LIRPLLLTLFILSACDTLDDSLLCNGSSSLCGQPINETLLITSHNSMTNEADEWFAPNHLLSLEDQLARGVRGFMLDTHTYQGDTYLCHGSCELGKITLYDALLKFKSFLQDNPNEVLVFILEAYVDGATTMAVFDEVGLDDHVYAHDAGATWPTLETLINAEQNILVFADNTDSDSPSSYMPIWQHMFETDWNNESLDDFNCDMNRGEADNAFFILNHFLTDPIASEELATEANTEAVLSSRIQACKDEHNKRPNFLAVDFVSIGDVFKVVENLSAAD
jgi:hypothetical protein